MIGGFKNNDYVATVNELLPELKTTSGEIESEHLPFLKRVVFAGKETPEGMLNFEDLKILGGDFPVEIYEENKKTLNTHDVVNMQYTSGTTGFPKGVMLTHYNILNNGKTIGDGMKFTKNDKLCITVPFFHCFGLVLAMMACITHGTTMVPVERYSPVPVMNAISAEKCTAVHGVPTMFIAMLEHAQFNNFDFSSLRTGIMAVGRAFPGVECKIIDPESGEELPVNTPGEFCARGYNIMKGYYKMPEATAQAIDKDGWLHTGDLCTVDEDGYYKVVGRIKDMIIRGGENIYPKEIEECLYTCDKVSDVQVIGVPSEAYGEEVMACVILKEGEEMTEEEVKEFVGARMAKHKVPRYVRFVDSFPTNAAGKIQKYKMREEAIEILKLQTAASIETA